MSDVLFKPGVDPEGVRLETIRAIAIAASVYSAFGKSLTVTSISDGKHSDNSLHYKGLAFDLRTRNDTGDLSQWANEIKQALATALRLRLGPDYDVVVEATHIHVEYDPE